MDEDFLVENLIKYGKIIQDDEPDPDNKAEEYFHKYVELVDSLTGKETEKVLKGLLRSIQVKHDYGAYQNTMNVAMDSYPKKMFVSALISELPRLIKEQPDWAGDLLAGIVNPHRRNYITEFNRQLFKDSDGILHTILTFIREQEKQGWLEDIPGVLGRKNSSWLGFFK